MPLNNSNLFNKKAAEIGEESTDVDSFLNDTFLIFFEWSSNKFECLEPRKKKYEIPSKNPMI